MCVKAWRHEWPTAHVRTRAAMPAFQAVGVRERSDRYHALSRPVISFGIYTTYVYIGDTGRVTHQAIILLIQQSLSNHGKGFFR